MQQCSWSNFWSKLPNISKYFIRSYSAFSVPFVCVFFSWSVLAAENTNMILLTTKISRPEVQLVDGELDVAHPGWSIELSRMAGKDCGADVQFDFMPWARALEKVRLGEAAALFNSSYLDERAEYGEFPRKNGELDKARASRQFYYYAYVRKDTGASGVQDDPNKLTGLFMVERDASVIPYLKERRAQIQESSDFKTMLRMVAGGRAEVAVGIGHYVETVLEENPELAERIVKIEKPLLERTGYIMFSKIFYAEHSSLVECFWSRSAELRVTDWFKAVRALYY